MLRHNFYQRYSVNELKYTLTCIWIEMQYFEINPSYYDRVKSIFEVGRYVWEEMWSGHFSKHLILKGKRQLQQCLILRFQNLFKNILKMNSAMRPHQNFRKNERYFIEMLDRIAIVPVLLWIWVLNVKEDPRVRWKWRKWGCCAVFVAAQY